MTVDVASRQSVSSMFTQIAATRHSPQITSSVPHASVRLRRSQSLVSLAISQPAGRRS